MNMKSKSTCDLSRFAPATQYTSIAFGNHCQDAGVSPSMGTVGDCFDNAMAESFFATLECELLDRTVFRTRDEARLEVFDFIEGFYNPKRRHSSIGYLSPVKFEARYHEQNDKITGYQDMGKVEKTAQIERQEAVFSQQ